MCPSPSNSEWVQSVSFGLCPAPQGVMPHEIPNLSNGQLLCALQLVPGGQVLPPARDQGDDDTMQPQLAKRSKKMLP